MEASERPSRPRPPSVERVLAAARERLGDRDHDAVIDAARRIIDAERARLATDAPTSIDRAPATIGPAGDAPTSIGARSAVELADDLIETLEDLERTAGPEPVINATGVIVHTNLGRAAWPAAAIEAARAAAASPLFLELDRETGRRGRRYRAAEEHLIALTGAEDALVTNNNAAALALAVGLAGRRGVAVSRGELVEIGGGVRIPEIIRRAGARLVEVGTTNRTRAADFEGPLAEGRAAVVLRVHRSNFVQTGFVEVPDAAELATLAHGHGALVIDDLGSGAFLDTATFGLAHEPTPTERLAASADLVCFSGDKLVGGPQAGLVVGRADLVARLRRDPLARAMRPDKVTLAAVAATLGLYRAGVAHREVPVWRSIAARPADLRERAERVRAALGTAAAARASVVDLESTIGGGSLPGQTLPSAGVALDGPATRLLTRLRRGDPAVVGRIDSERVVLDLRTVEPERDGDLAAAIDGAVGRA